ncbi:S-adenosylmethionine:tRNA ribosyltransferase-isomerase, partial [Pelagophyceae sp. CCMP2097]
YHLPDERIARYPASPRGSSKLLHRSADGVLKDYRFDTDLVNTLPKDAILVVNESRVVHGRVAAKLDGSTLEAFEVMLLNPAAKGDSAYPADAVSSKADGQTWLAMIRRAATKKGDDGVEALVRFHVAENETMDAVLQKVGEVPLPPYLRRAPDDSDTTAYQTAYAQEAGSVAAPTAGLHFTPKVLEAVRASGRTIVAVALHVGAGTFKPLTSPNLADHDMHAEHFSIKKTALTQLRDAALQNRPIVAVGTTAARALESLAALSRCSNGVRASTSLCIAPGFQFQIVDSLVTNFHHPDSTLVALVAALVGGEGETHSLYSHALEKDYRFLSYGDACLLDNPAAASKQRRGD